MLLGCVQATYPLTPPCPFSYKRKDTLTYLYVYVREDATGLTLHRDDDREHRFAFDCVMSQDVGQREVYEAVPALDVLFGFDVTYWIRKPIARIIVFFYVAGRADCLSEKSLGEWPVSSCDLQGQDSTTIAAQSPRRFRPQPIQTMSMSEHEVVKRQKSNNLAIARLSREEKLVVTSASLLVTGALLLVTRS